MTFDDFVIVPQWEWTEYRCPVDECDWQLPPVEDYATIGDMRHAAEGHLASAHAAVAQGSEQGAHNAEGAGSSPVRRTEGVPIGPGGMAYDESDEERQARWDRWDRETARIRRTPGI